MIDPGLRGRRGPEHLQSCLKWGDSMPLAVAKGPWPDRTQPASRPAYGPTCLPGASAVGLVAALSALAGQAAKEHQEWQGPVSARFLEGGFRV